MPKVPIKQVDISAEIQDAMDTDTLFEINGWQALVSEVVSEDEGFHGILLYVPGVTFAQLQKK